MQNRFDQLHEHFIKNYQITKAALLRDFINEVRDYDPDRLERAARAARLSAATKRFRTSRAIEFVIQISSKEYIDLTPLVARRLCQSWFNRSGSQSILVGIFGQKERSERSSTSQEQLCEIAVRHKVAADVWLQETELIIKNVKKTYSESHK